MGVGNVHDPTQSHSGWLFHHVPRLTLAYCRDDNGAIGPQGKPIHYVFAVRHEDAVIEELTNKIGGKLSPASWVAEHGDFLYRYALSRLRDGDAAEEVVQESFVAALRHVEQYSATGSERAWLLGILKRKIIDLVRARNRTASLSSEDSTDPSEALFDRSGSWRKEIRNAGFAPLDSLESEDFWRILRTCLDTLPSRHADVFVLREVDELDTEEICKELEVTASNLWVILHRARLKLSMCMKTRWLQDAS
ncbi:sigma-70 family RNA polymerase sigma factor [Adhaeretor mobilis]|uniref:RNA polymerase sigma factor n=1 Tax=Adhaeretor mobilis TaxID=1930276 RepID=A0A517N0V9_9BACT|nr:sigma-70 family RNA polymerase sigma factor [Adhaeretor mobilis]QDT00754.1 RNA polymerase sigma factor SigM [Adhaeretor mobilis]